MAANLASRQGFEPCIRQLGASWYLGTEYSANWMELSFLKKWKIFIVIIMSNDQAID